jgi:hypothetical protein
VGCVPDTEDDAAPEATPDKVDALPISFGEKDARDCSARISASTC